MPSENLRKRYESDGTGVVPSNRLLIMLMNRLVDDVRNARVAMDSDSFGVVNAKLCNAQAILFELHAALDTDVWPDGAGLARLYLWLVNELLAANVDKDPERLDACLPMVEQLRDAWQGAYDQTTNTVSPAVAPTAPAAAAQ